MGGACGPEGRQPLGQSLLKLEPTGFGLGPLAGLGALAKVVAVHLPADPLRTVAPPAGAVLRKLAAGGVAGKDGKQHRAPTSEVRLPAERKSVKRAQRTNHVQNCASLLAFEDKLLKTSSLKLVEAAGVELFHSL